MARNSLSSPTTVYRHLEFPTDFGRYVMNKKESAKSYYRYLLSRCSKMFQYKNLPDTIPHEILDRYLMNNGIACITRAGEKQDLYVFFGNAGGPQDEYYRPTQFIIANPHIKVDGTSFSANVHIFGKPNESDTCEGVLIRNDSEWQGLYPMLARYSFLMAENILTLRTADVLLRITALLTAPTDKERIAANEFLKNLEDGVLGTIGEQPFFDGIRMQSPPSNNGSYLTQFIEYQQYLKGSLFNELGLSANYNMKREAIGKGESTLDEDALLPLCENMLQCRREDLAKVNSLFGTDISVDFSSAWLTNVIESLKILNPVSPLTSAPMPTSGDGQVGSTGDESGQLGSANNNTEEDSNGQNGLEEDGEAEKTGSEGKGLEETREAEKTGSEGKPDGYEELDETNTEESESRINDLSQDPNYTPIYEEVVSQLKNDEQDVVELGESEVVENGETKTADDKEDISNN